MKTKITNEVRVSEETLALINCHRSLQGLYTQTVEALALQYGGNMTEAEAVIEGEFGNCYRELKKVLENYLTDSITQNIAFQDVKQI